MIYTSAIYADAAHTQVKGTDANGQIETRPLSEPHEFRRAGEFITGFLKDGGVIAPYEPPTPVIAPPEPHLYAAVAVSIAAGAISVIEQAAQLSSAAYDAGWLMIVFADPPVTDYLIFAQTDVPAKIEQFKSGGYFELVFSNPSTGAEIEPGRVDIQILKVR